MRKKLTVVNLVFDSDRSVLVSYEVGVRSGDESEHSLCPETKLSGGVCGRMRFEEDGENRRVHLTTHCRLGLTLSARHRTGTQRR